MLSVLQPGWLLLLLCGIVLLLVGCTSFPSRTPVPSATAYPYVTLTVYPFATQSPQPRSTRPTTSTDVPVRTPLRLTPRGASEEPPIRLNPEAPTCYTGVNRGITCLGRVWNRSDTTVHQVVVRVTLMDEHGRVVAAQSVGLEQRTISPDSFAPYRALFGPEDAEGNQARVQLEQAYPGSDDGPALTLNGARGVIASSGRYVITASVRNDSAESVPDARLIVTLLDAEDRVIGYRVLPIVEAIAPGDERAVRTEIIPLVLTDDIHYNLTLEVWATPPEDDMDPE